MHTREDAGPTTFSNRVKSQIKRLMTVSKRRGAWFSLEKREKSIMYLSLKLDVKFASLDLLRALISIFKKLEQHGETLYARLQRGTKLAWAFSEFAVRCGNLSARSWRNDREYALHLGTLFPGTFGRGTPP